MEGYARFSVVQVCGKSLKIMKIPATSSTTSSTNNVSVVLGSIRNNSNQQQQAVFAVLHIGPVHGPAL